jgi:hypothetical protein
MPVFRRREQRIFVEDLLCVSSGVIKQAHIADQVRHTEVAQARLAHPIELAGPSELEVLFGDVKAAVRGAHHLEPALAVLRGR